MAEETKNLCAQIPASLHAQVREQQEASGKTLGQYMTWLIQTFYEKQSLAQGLPITYLSFVIDHDGPYVSPDWDPDRWPR